MTNPENLNNSAQPPELTWEERRQQHLARREEQLPESQKEVRRQLAESYQAQQLWLADQQAEQAKELDRLGITAIAFRLAGEMHEKQWSGRSSTDYINGTSRLTVYSQTLGHFESGIKPEFGVMVHTQDNFYADDPNPPLESFMPIKMHEQQYPSMSTSDKLLYPESEKELAEGVIEYYARDNDGIVEHPDFTAEQAAAVKAMVDSTKAAQAMGIVPNLSYDLQSINYPTAPQSYSE